MKSKEVPESALFAPLLDQNVVIKFDGHVFKTKLVEVSMQKLTDLKNPPAKRKGDQKSYTPKCLRLSCTDGALVVAVEDCQIAAIHNGVVFVFGDYTLEVRRAG